jgi:hypothetical protein
MNYGAESHSLPFQLKKLREVFEAWPTKSPNGADIAFAYITLCASIEYTIGVHLRVELRKLTQLMGTPALFDACRILNRTKEDGWTEPYDGSIGQGMLQRLLSEIQVRSERLTFGDISRELQWFRGTTLPKQCGVVDDYLWGDLLGLSALRNIYAHGRPMRIETEEESRFNLESPAFGMQEVVKSLKRIGVIKTEGDFFNQAGQLFDVLGSNLAITFYWRRTGEFVRTYVDGVAYDGAFHPTIEEAAEALKPLNIAGVDCL